MGKGDKKTRRGKLFSGSYGVLRPRKKKRSFSVVSPTNQTVRKQQPVRKPKVEPEQSKVRESEAKAEPPKSKEEPKAKETSEKEREGEKE